MSTNSPPPSLAGRAAAVAVGLFATWQLVALPAANLALFVPLRPVGAPLESTFNPVQARGTFTDAEPVQRAADGAGRVLELWAEASGQEQGWSLFAPGPPPYSAFVAVEFSWADGTSDTLLSDYEPRDPARPPLRAPLIRCRHYHFEVQFVYPAWYASPEAVAEFPQTWADLPDTVRASGAEIRAWLRWRLNDYLAAHPGRGRPVSAVMKHRYIPTPHPGAAADSPRPVAERPYARWRLDRDDLDAFDVVTMRFVPAGAKP